MKRRIKRTEITIETVEITTIRRARPDDARGETTHNETIVMDFSLAGPKGPVGLPAGSEHSNTHPASVITDLAVNAKVE